MNSEKRKYKVNTWDYGIAYVWATSPAAARSRVGFRIYGRHCWDYGDIDNWEVTDVTDK